jgi:hypothetical protein
MGRERACVRGRPAGTTAVTRREQTLAERVGPLWCEDFDADLPKVVPQALDVLGDLANVELVTYSHATNGKINCPSAWWTDHGLTAFFATPGWGGPAPAGYWTDKKVVACTFWDTVRDEWIHDATVIVNGRFVWKPPVQLMHRLMFDLRGWTPLDDIERASIQKHVRASLAAAAERLQAVIA